MDEHFTRIRDLEEAVIRGDVEAAKEPARWIADHQETAGLPEGTQRFATEMKTAASSVAAADDLTKAAASAAEVLSTCGHCHAAAKITPKMPEAVPPVAAPGTAGHMRAHQYAIDLMYRGLIVPSTALWMKGAEALKAAPLADKELAKFTKEPGLFEARVHELASQAVNAPDTSTRVAIYGELIGGCASCHGLHGKVWGPGLPKTK
jgi:cytochrome c553